MNFNRNDGFTLIELLVAVALLSVIVIFVLAGFNPMTVLRESRDARRLKDIDVLKRAIEIYISSKQDPKLGLPNTLYATAAVEGATTGASDRNNGNISQMGRVDSTGWLPINFSSVTSGPPLPNLLFDPGGDYSFDSNYYYRYMSNGVDWELNTRLESEKYREKMQTDRGNSKNWYEVGSKLDILGN